MVLALAGDAPISAAAKFMKLLSQVQRLLTSSSGVSGLQYLVQRYARENADDDHRIRHLYQVENLIRRY